MLPEAKAFYEEIPDLFDLVHQFHLFDDGKLWADATPKIGIEALKHQWQNLEDKSPDKVRQWVENSFHFTSPTTHENGHIQFQSHAETHIRNLWPLLLRKGGFSVPEGSSLLTLPFDYIVPGGRFNEIYYWDSYFTMLGLAHHGGVDTIRHMVNNFAYFIQYHGFIPNGNRSYFLSRSQPPFFVLMVELLVQLEGENVMHTMAEVIEKEYTFWMTSPRCVHLENGFRLNRYADGLSTPRIEMYEDDRMLEQHTQAPDELFLHIRAACESGWDFSSRWMDDANDLLTIRAHDILPVDLNALLFKTETLLAGYYLKMGQHEKGSRYNEYAGMRKKAMKKYCWQEGWYDYDLKYQRTTGKVTAAAMVPLFVKLCDAEEAHVAADKVLHRLMCKGGIKTTEIQSGQQWDEPNGWAPLQWMAVKGLENYGMVTEAREIAERWLALNEKIYQQTGKMLEKYNVVNTDLPGGGGEYPVQDGFGWTNGVFVALKHWLSFQN